MGSHFQIFADKIFYLILICNGVVKVFTKIVTPENVETFADVGQWSTEIGGYFAKLSWKRHKNLTFSRIRVNELYAKIAKILPK